MCIQDIFYHILDNPLILPVMSAETNKSLPDQRAMIAALQARKRSALVELYQNYSAALYRILMDNLSDEELAKEGLQDVFLKIWDNIDRYNPHKGRLFTWMAQIARNTAIDISRSKRFKKKGKTGSLPDYVYNSSQLSEESTTEDIGLQRVLQQLSEEERKVVQLVYFQSFTHKEVSEHLDMPLGTVKTRVRKALQKLKKLLDKEGLYIISIIVILYCLL